MFMCYSKKGFVKILEAVIASIILIGSVSYFFIPYIKSSDWSRSNLELQGRDALVALDNYGYLRTFILENNITEDQKGLEYYLKKMLPKSVMFSVEVYGLPKPVIKLGCNCTSAEMEKLQKMIYDKRIEFKGREINFSIDAETGLENLLANRDIDVILLFGYKDLSPYKSEMEEFLGRDKSILVIADLNETEVNDGIFNETFNLSWQVGGILDENNDFSDLSDPKNISWHISNYFVYMPVRIETTEDIGNGERKGNFFIQGIQHDLITGYNETGSFDYVRYDTDTKQYKLNEVFIVDGWSIKIRRIDSNYTDDYTTYADISIINRSYVFNISNTPSKNNIAKNEKTILKTTNGFSSVQSNYQITKYGKGRTVWLKNYTETYSDVNQLFKSILLWAAGENYDLGQIFGHKKMRPKSYTKVYYVVSGNQEFEPYIIKLVLWHIY